MIRGLYTSAWGMVASSKKLDVISNNLANVNTNGYKKDTVVYETFADLLVRRINDEQTGVNPDGSIGNMEYGSDIGEIHTLYKQGKLIQTGTKTDLSIKDSDTAFFAIEISEEEEGYTRNGAFTLNAEGRLVTQDGLAVKGIDYNGEEVPIILNSEKFSVTSSGAIIQDGEEVARLLVRQFENPDTLRKSGNNIVMVTEDTIEEDFTGTIQQGALEESNVNPVKEMIDMISVMRAYEANQKILRSQDETLEKAVNEIGAVR